MENEQSRRLREIRENLKKTEVLLQIQANDLENLKALSLAMEDTLRKLTRNIHEEDR